MRPLVTATPWRSYQRLVGSMRGQWADPLYRNSYFLMTNTVVNSGSGFVFWLLAARMATPEDLGLATGLVGAIAFLTLLAKAGLDILLLRRLPLMTEKERPALVRTSLALSGALALVAGAVFALGTTWWSPSLSFLAGDLRGIAGMALLTSVWTLGFMLDSVFIAGRRAHLVLTKTVAHAMLKLAILLVLAAPLGWLGVLLAANASMAPVLVLLGMMTMRRWAPARGSASGAVALLSEWQALLANFAVSLLLAVPPSLGAIIVLERGGPVAAAQFYIIWMFGSFAMMAPMAFGQTGLVEMTRSGNRNLLLRARPLVVTASIASAVLVAGHVLLPVFGEAYRDVGVATLLPFVLASLPGLVVQARLAQLRVLGHHVRLVVLPGIAIGGFIGALLMLPAEPLMAGLGWLGAMTVTALCAHLVSPPFAAPPDRPREVDAE